MMASATTTKPSEKTTRPSSHKQSICAVVAVQASLMTIKFLPDERMDHYIYDTVTYLGVQVKVGVLGHRLGHAGGDAAGHGLDADVHLPRHLAKIQGDVLAALVAADDHHHLAVERVGNTVRVGMQVPPAPLVHA